MHHTPLPGLWTAPPPLSTVGRWNNTCRQDREWGSLRPAPPPAYFSRQRPHLPSNRLCRLFQVRKEASDSGLRRPLVESEQMQPEGGEGGEAGSVQGAGLDVTCGELREEYERHRLI